MKNIILKSATCLFFAIMLLACIEEETENSLSIEQGSGIQIPTDMGGMNFGGVVLPNGTTSEISPDGRSLKVYLPEGIKYISNFNGRLLIADEGGYTCSSTCSGGCDVVKLGEDVGCSACPAESKEECVGKHTDEGFYSIGQGDGGGFVDLKQGVSFVVSSDNKVENFQTPDWEVLVKHPEVEKALVSFVNELWNNAEINQNSSDLVLVNVFGTYIRMHAPKGFSNSKMANELISGDDVSCSCSSGDGGCDHEEITAGIGPLKKKIGDKCVAGGCESCSMSW